MGDGLNDALDRAETLLVSASSDEPLSLPAGDLALLVEAARRGASVVAIRSIDLGQAGGWDALIASADDVSAR